MSVAELKKRILRLLREDEELRYAILGLLGLGELLKRAEEHDRKFNEILGILKEHSRRFEEHDRKFNEITAILVEHGRRLNKHEEILTGLLMEMKSMRAGLESVSTTLQRLTTSIEDEGGQPYQA